MHHLREPVRAARVHADLLERLANNLNGDALLSIGFMKGASTQMQLLLEGLADLATATDVPRRSAVGLDLAVRLATLFLKKEIIESSAGISCEGLPEVPHSDISEHPAPMKCSDINPFDRSSVH